MASSSGTDLSRSQTMLVDSPNNDDSELVPSRLASIVPILRVANAIEKDNPRVAYLCRFHAWEKAHQVDPTSSGRGVRQFNTYLLHRLEREEEETEPMLARSDPREIQKYYQQFYVKNIANGQYTKKPEEMAKSCQIASVLYDVIRTVVPVGRVDDETQRIAKEVEKKKEQFEPYNILPFYAVGVTPAIMELPEIKAALRAIQNVEDLPMPREREKPINDVLDWLSCQFGFQKGNVANQREHLILLLANIDVRKKEISEDYIVLNAETIQKLMYKIFNNYLSWCNYLRCRTNLRYPISYNRQQLELIYISLYLLIWGEASNIRFMPECLCYIFHNMANEVYGIIFGNVVSLSGDTYPTAAADDESFLRNVITPIYNVLIREAKRSKGGKASHCEWRNYDDLNEYFWSRECFKLRWPMDRRADFFLHSDELSANERNNQVTARKRKHKTNFVEARTFWHLYRSFDRLWIFFIMAFQAMLIVAWNSGSLLGFFDEDILRKVLTIFMTAAFLNFLQATLDIFLSFSAWRSLNFSQILRYLLKFAVAAFWVVVLPIGYSSSVKNPTGLVRFFNKWIHDWKNESLYNYCLAIYLIPNTLNAIVFLLPPLRKTMERSNMRIITLIMWWTQPKSYVGRGMHEDFFSLMKYTMFWILLLISKLAFSYYVEILPLVEPTKIIMDLHVDNYQWHEFFSEAKTHNIGVVIAIWSPIVLVYFMDAQIWYAIFSTLFGGIRGVFSHLGEIQTLGMLRSRFESVLRAFCHRLVPYHQNRKRPSDEATERKNIAIFYLVWNKFILSMRMQDLINNRDRDLLLVPSSLSDVSVVQWPLFLLAGKIPIALDIAKDFKKKDDADLFKNIAADEYMRSAVTECYETLKDIIYNLLEDEANRIIVRKICYEVEISIQQQRFLTDFRMSQLPALCNRLDKFLRILLSDNDIEDVTFRSQIINDLQDIMHLITQDVMVNGSE